MSTDRPQVPQALAPWLSGQTKHLAGTEIVRSPRQIGFLDALRMIHYGPQAVISFCRKANGFCWQGLGAVGVDELEAKMTILQPFFDGDLYFGLNSTYSQDAGKRKRRVASCQDTGFPIYSRRAKSLRWLNCVAADIDAGHDGSDFSFEKLTQSFISRILLCSLPIPNFMVDSGRGMWALWLLTDYKSVGRPVSAWPEKQAQVERLNRAIVRMFDELGADSQAVDSARVMRCPNSTNTAAKPARRVRFYLIHERRYTWPELAGPFGVKAQKTSVRPTRETKNPKRVAAGRLRWVRPLQGFLDLWDLRGTFTKGTRNCAVWCYAVLLRKTRHPEREIVARCQKLANACSPALSQADVMKAVRSSANVKYRISNSVIAKKLRITIRELAALPNWFRPAKQRQDKRERQRQKVKLRRAHLLLEVQKHAPLLPSVRFLAHRMESAHGIRVSHGTIANDLKVLRVQSQEHERRKKRKGRQQGGVAS